MFSKLLMGPSANPFRMRNTPGQEKKRLGVNDGYNLTWQKKALPGAGAQQYSWETYGLPPFGVFGKGNIHVESPSIATQPAGYVFQSVGVVGNPPSSLFQGQFTTQPLMDPNTATALGLVEPGAIPNTGPNSIMTAAPLLSP